MFWFFFVVIGPQLSPHDMHSNQTTWMTPHLSNCDIHRPWIQITSESNIEQQSNFDNLAFKLALVEGGTSQTFSCLQKRSFHAFSSLKRAISKSWTLGGRPHVAKGKDQGALIEQIWFVDPGLIIMPRVRWIVESLPNHPKVSKSFRILYCHNYHCKAVFLPKMIAVPRAPREITSPIRFQEGSQTQHTNSTVTVTAIWSKLTASESQSYLRAKNNINDQRQDVPFPYGLWSTTRLVSDGAP